MNFVVRPANFEDAGNLAALNQVVQALHVGAEPGRFRSDAEFDEVKAFFGELMRAPATFVLIAEIDRPAGYIWFDVQDRPPTPFTYARSRLYIHHVVVRTEARGLGLGSALLHAAEAEARAQGIREVALDTWAFNEDARQFFQATGFEPEQIVMRKDFL
jgi:GNAT superfamily N-acetyltransferase